MSNRSEENAKQLGKELTSDYPLAVYGMALSCTEMGAGFEISSSAVTAVRANGCELRVTLCKGDLCQMKRPVYEFSKTLNETATAKEIAAQVIPQVCAPKPSWLVTDPLAFIILVVCGGLAYGTYMGVEAMTDALLQAPKLEATIGMIFGSSQTFALAVNAAFYFSVVAHAIEACLAIQYATSLQLPLGSKGLWALLVFLVGYPVFSRLQKLVAMDRGHTKSK